ncbi:hypothetical protein LCGC14_0328260 [marine sediment metagenome]|uniref:Uncharacterized protein n=1 Tax=marine sediment metagenome TaxID=412755 RepID=A0A0F9TZZ3_9ZZZZ
MSIKSLKELGATTATIFSKGDASGALTKALTGAMIAAISINSFIPQPVQAADLYQSPSVGIEVGMDILTHKVNTANPDTIFNHSRGYDNEKLVQGSNIAATGVTILISPEAGLVRLGVKAIAGAAVGELSNEHNKGYLAADIGGALVFAAASATPYGYVIAANSIKNAYDNYQDRVQDHYNSTLRQHTSSISKIVDGIAAKSYLEERAQRMALAEPDRIAANKQLYETAMFAAKDSAPDFLMFRLQQEGNIVQEGGEPEQWYTDFSRDFFGEEVEVAKKTVASPDKTDQASRSAMETMNQTLASIEANSKSSVGSKAKVHFDAFDSALAEKPVTQSQPSYPTMR